MFYDYFIRKNDARHETKVKAIVAKLLRLSIASQTTTERVFDWLWVEEYSSY